MQLFSQLSKFYFASQRYKQGNSHGLKEKWGLSLIITRYSKNLLKTKEKAKAGLQERLRMSMSNIFSVMLILPFSVRPPDIKWRFRSHTWIFTWFNWLLNGEIHLNQVEIQVWLLNLHLISGGQTEEGNKNGSLSAKNLWTLIKSKFNIDVGRTRIIEILNVMDISSDH